MGASLSRFNYAKKVEASEATDKRTAIYRGPESGSTLISNFSKTPCKNAWDLFQHGKNISPHGRCLGTREVLADGSRGEFVWKTYTEVERLALNAGGGLAAFDLIPQCNFVDEPKYPNMRFLAIFSSNREEWIISEQACNAYGVTIVPLYDTLGCESTQFILSQCRIKCVVASTDCLIKLLEALHNDKEGDTPAKDSEVAGKLCVSAVITLDPVPVETATKAKALGIELIAWADLLKKGEENPLPLDDKTVPTPETIGNICYTSGTTGPPKGVIMTHSNFVAVIAGTIDGPLDSEHLRLSAADSCLSYLPLAHVYERFTENLLFYLGGSVGFFSGDMLKLLEDLQVLKPTIFCSVPRLFCRINDRVFASLRSKSAIARMLFNQGLESKIKKLRSTGNPEHAIWDRLVFNKTKSLLGGNVRFILCGSAPLDPVIQDRMKCLFCCPLLEGYGLTETLAATFITNPHDPISGHVGGCVPTVEFMLSDVSEEMGEYSISSESPKGELCVRGSTTTPGYFRNEVATAEAIDADGWLHTGDVACLLENGAIKIIDRKKNIFKLAQGEYVAPEKVERIYALCPAVAQCFVFGYSSENYLVGIVVVDEAWASRWCTDHGLGSTPLSDVMSNPELIADIQKQLDDTGRTSGLKGFELAKKIALELDPFTVENGLLTPTFKLKRYQAKVVYSDVIDRLYGRPSTPPPN